MTDAGRTEMNQPCGHGDDTAAYVLGALDARELPAFLRHLETCTVCAEEVASFQQIANVLPLAAPRHAAPPALRRRVIRAVRDDAVSQIRPQTAPARRASGWTSGSNWASGLRGGMPRPGLVGLAAATVLVLVVIGVGLVASGTGSTNSNGTRVYDASIGSAEVVVDRSGHGQLIVHHLSKLGSAKTYEVWYQESNGQVVSSTRLFNVSASGDDAVRLPGRITGITKVMVTREKAGGSLTPHPPLVVSATVS